MDCLVGAFMLVRRETIEQVGGLDETFFMYGEDIDWCYRIKQAGWGVHYYPRTTIIHYKGGAPAQPFKIIYEFHRAMILFIGSITGRNTTYSLMELCMRALV